MKNWLLLAASVAAGVTINADMVSALSPTADEVSDSFLEGQCRLYASIFGRLNSSLIVMGLPGDERAYYPGGGYFGVGNEVRTGLTPITKSTIATCFGLQEADVVYFVADGPDGSYAEDDLYGFGFVLSKSVGRFQAGQFYTFTFGSGALPPPPPSIEDLQTSAIVQQIVTADAARQLTSQISSNQRLVREGRTRFIQSRGQMAGGGSGLASRNVVDFDVDGAFNVDNGRISTKGTFFEQAGNFEGTSRRIFFGDFDVQHDSDTNSTTASLAGKVAWERMLDDRNMLGYFLGADLAYSDIGGLYKGDQSSYGVSVGAYYVSALRDNLFVDAFLTLGAGQHDLKLSNGLVDLKGDYDSYTATLGAALTGVIARKGYEIWPEIALTYGYTELGTIGMTDRNAASVNNRVIVDAGSVSIANLTIRPEFRVPMDGRSNADSLSLLTFAPRFLCEQVDAVRTTEDCGAGAEIGLDTTSRDGNSRLVARIKADRIASSTRTGLELKLEHQF